MAAKRAIKAKEEQKEAIANETIRRKSGKVLAFSVIGQDTTYAFFRTSISCVKR